MKAQKINQHGLLLVKHFESLFLTAYRDPVGVWTCGWGHTGLEHNDGTVYEGRVISKDKAEELLAHDMRKFEYRVNSLATVPLGSDQFSALVSFDFNTGALGKSSLLKRLNEKDPEAAAMEFLKWNKGGRPLRVFRGLTRRRKSEKNLFEGKADYLLLELPRSAFKAKPAELRKVLYDMANKPQPENGTPEQYRERPAPAQERLCSH